MKNIFKNKNVLILGLGKSGIGSFKLLEKMEAYCYVYDKDKQVLKSFENKKNCNIIFEVDEEIVKLMDFLILSPGISVFDERVKIAKLYGVRVFGEIELASLFLKGKVVSITGTNGKTTTSNLIYHILKTANRFSILAGNVGEPLTENILPFKTNYVIETSSFQLESIEKFRPNIAVITNITANHLDRHLTFKNYVDAKFNIFKNMQKKDILILNFDDKILRRIATKCIKPKIVFTSVFKEIDGFFYKKSAIFYKKSKKIKKICDISSNKLLGIHNIQNILFAVVVATKLKIKRSVIEKAISTFEPLKHRLQFVKNVDGVDFVNDSKSTSVDSTITAINAFKNKPIILILGGSDKNTTFDYLAGKIKKSKNIKLVVVNGKTSKKIIASFKKYNFQNFVQAKDFKDAVLLSKQNSNFGDTILLSPACASFDAFSSFEERGDEFIKLTDSF